MNPFVYVHSLPCPQGYCAGWHCPGWVVLDAVTLVPLGPVAGKGKGKGKGKGLCVSYLFFPSCSLFFFRQERETKLPGVMVRGTPKWV